MKKRPEFGLISMFQMYKEKENAEIMKKNVNLESDFKTVFESVPGLYLLLLPDLKIEAVSDEYLAATMTTRSGIIGKYLFDVFPDNPNDPTADGVSNLHTSLIVVLETKAAHTMEVQKYDIQRPDGIFEERFWSPLNKPVLDANGEISYLIHSVVDVTRRVLDERELKRAAEEYRDYTTRRRAAIFP